jgi:pyridoxine/pyridoxamine 5'-phosphate oxidase
MLQEYQHLLAQHQKIIRCLIAPDYWGGFKLVPIALNFGKAARIDYDRFVYEYDKKINSLG